VGCANDEMAVPSNALSAFGPSRLT
jgi:hypothetical protein